MVLTIQFNSILYSASFKGDGWNSLPVSCIALFAQKVPKFFKPIAVWFLWNCFVSCFCNYNTFLASVKNNDETSHVWLEWRSVWYTFKHNGFVNWLLRQQGIATPTPISLDKHCVFAPIFTLKSTCWFVCLTHVLSNRHWPLANVQIWMVNIKWILMMGGLTEDSIVQWSSQTGIWSESE